MAHVEVRSDADHRVLMSEQVLPVHLDSERSALPFLERLYSAVEDKGNPSRSRRGETHRKAEAVRQEHKRRR